MRKLIFTAALIALFILGCEKEYAENVPAPVEYSVEPNTRLEIELQIAESELLTRMYECSVKQVQRAKLKPVKIEVKTSLEVAK